MNSQPKDLHDAFHNFTQDWYAEHGFTLSMTMAQACSASHSGQCDADVLALSKEPDIAAQLDSIPPAALREELREYGAWEDAELSDHTQNLQRILWIAANDLREGNRP